MYSWLVGSFIMVFIVAIAIFYQKKFNVRTYYYLYLIPIAILVISAFQLFPMMNEFIHLLGSLGSFLASYFLYRKMVGVR